MDRGAHEAAIDNGWLVAGHMPRDARDELGPIPPNVARFLRAHEKRSYGARTEANVRDADALLVVVRDADDPRATPGTATTIDLAARRHLRRMIVDPSFSARPIAEWLRRWLLVDYARQQLLPIETRASAPAPSPVRLLVAGPRESRWPGARVETAGLLRRVALELREISAVPSARSGRGGA